MLSLRNWLQFVKNALTLNSYRIATYFRDHLMCNEDTSPCKNVLIRTTLRLLILNILNGLISLQRLKGTQL